MTVAAIGDRYWCELALVGDAVAERVTISVADGRITAVDAGGPAPPGATRLAGLTVPGLANTHSHAFHRALRARTHAAAGTFWAWRDAMYRVAARLDPDRYHRLARAVFGEMALAGITAVGEFHYVHHRADGAPYADPNAMGEAILAAATEAGVRITLLDTLYLHGGLAADGHIPVTGVQRRFADPTPEAWAERVEQLTPAAGQQVGAAVHSVRAVDPGAMLTVAEWARRRDGVVHAHVSEQPIENEQCLVVHGRTPTGVARDAGLLGERFTAVHATHVTADDVAALAASSSAVCLCPTTERDLADGIGPSAELAAAGVALALGTDSHAVVDPFEEARAVELDERLRSGRRGAHAAGDLLAMATRVGQCRLGWPDAGALAVGHRADLVTLDLASRRTAGATPVTAVEAAVFAATAADVTHVVVDGVVVVADSRHLGVDVPAALAASIAELTAP